MTLSTPVDPYSIATKPDAENIIVTKELKKVFGDFVAVEDVSFYVPRASIFGFIGPSGSGKTTTIRMLTGIYQPSDGEVLVLGKHPHQFTQSTRAKIGYMPQLFVLYPNLTVWENLYFAASLYGMSLVRGRRMKRVLDFVELNEHRDKLARDISGGMQSRLSLAATLVHDPELIFLDEPTAGIDPVLRRKFWDHFKELQGQGNTIFITTQYVNEAAFCDYVGILSNNRLLMVSTPETLRKRAFGGDVVDMKTTERMQYIYERMLRDLPFVTGDVIHTGLNNVRIIVKEASTAIPELLEWARDQGLSVKAVEEYVPPFEEVFVQLVQEDGRE